MVIERCILCNQPVIYGREVFSIGSICLDCRGGSETVVLDGRAIRLSPKHAERVEALKLYQQVQWQRGGISYEDIHGRAG
jgi:hypothetical protein